MIRRPIIVLDLETTGVDVREDRIVSIAALRVEPGDYRTTGEKHYLVNPGVPIPEEATAIHGITDDMVKNAPRFRQYAEGFLAYLEGCDLAGYNIRGFDLPMLYEELARAGHQLDLDGRRIVDMQLIYFHQHPRNLLAAVKEYVGVELDPEKAHDALFDTRCARDVMLGQLETVLPWEGPDGKDIIESMHRLCDELRPVRLSEVERWFDGEGDELRFRQGKYEGRTLLDIAANEPGYLDWMLRKIKHAELTHVVATAQMKVRGPAKDEHQTGLFAEGEVPEKGPPSAIGN